MEASRRQPGMLEGLSRFLIQHERCGAGFDVAHPAGLGSGRVSITCRGCGARHEYATATIEFERELKIETTQPPRRPPPPPRRPPSAIPPRPAPYPESSRPPAATPPAATPPPAARRPAASAAGADTGPAPGQLPTAARSGGGAAVPVGVADQPRVGPGRPRVREPAARPAAVAALRRFWSSPRATTALFVLAAVALGFAVVRLVNGDGSSESDSSRPAPQLTAPPTAVPTPASPGEAGSLPTPAQPPSATATKPSGTTLRTQHFTIEAPAGWSEQTSAGGLLLRPRGGGRVNVQVFFERSPGLASSRMADQTARFLRGEVPGASIFRRKIQLAGRSADELTARGPGETAIAVDVLHGPYRYLLVRRIFAGAKPQTSLAAGRTVMSFTPR